MRAGRKQMSKPFVLMPLNMLDCGWESAASARGGKINEQVNARTHMLTRACPHTQSEVKQVVAQQQQQQHG